MRQCLVCGATWAADEEQCRQCHTPLAELQKILATRQEPRFIFAEIEPTPAKPETQKRAETGRRSPVSPRNEDSEMPPAAPRPIPESRAIREPATLIRAQVAPVTVPLTERQLQPWAILMDIALCALLNALVFQLIRWVSPRSTSELVHFSLIPLLFVLMGFTLLFFWVFLGVFGQTLGTMIWNRLQRRKRNPA